MFNHHWREIPAGQDEDDDSVPATARARFHDVPWPIDIAFVVGAIRAHAPDLADDLDEAITVWLEQPGALAVRRDEPSRLNTRQSRLQALRELLSLSPYEPDARD